MKQSSITTTENEISNLYKKRTASLQEGKEMEYYSQRYPYKIMKQQKKTKATTNQSKKPYSDMYKKCSGTVIRSMATRLECTQLPVTTNLEIKKTKT